MLVRHCRYSFSGYQETHSDRNIPVALVLTVFAPPLARCSLSLGGQGVQRGYYRGPMQGWIATEVQHRVGLFITVP